MIVNPQTTDGAAYIAECLKASRTPQLFFKMVHRDGNGNITSAPVYDTSQIKSYKISDSICNNSDYSVGNVPNMEFECEVFNSTDDTENVVEMEVFFNPFDDNPSTVRQDIENATVGDAPSNPHTARIATFYCTGAYFYEGLMVFRGVDAVGLHTNAYWPDSDGLTYPVSGRQMLNSALLWGGFKTIPSSQSFVNLDDIAFSEPPVGYTVRQVLEILCAMEGANLVHVNDYRSSGGAEYDFKVLPMYPGRYTYANLAGRSLPEMWAYDTTPVSYATIHDSNIFNIKRLQKPIVFAGVQYAGTYYDGSTSPNGSTYYLEIPQNEMLNNLSNATLATYMNRLADIYKGWNYFPINMTCVSVPFVQDFDRMFLPEQNLSEAVVTSTNLTGLGSETIVTAGNTVPMNDYRYSGKGVSRYDKNAAMLNRLYKFIYPGKDNIAIGGVPLKYATMPPYLFTNYFDLSQKGKATFYGDVDVKGNVRIADASGRLHALGNSIVQRADSVNPLTASGWYRVFECDFLGSANALGSNSQFVDITVRTSSTSANGTLHSIRLSLKTNAIEFVDELSDGNANRISQIRYMTKGQYGYIDVYFDNGGGNLYSSTDLIARPYQYNWVPVDYTSVVEAPTGETRQAIYSFTTAGHVNPLSERIDGQLTANGNVFANAQLSVDGNAYFHRNAYLRDVATHNYNIKQVTRQGIRDLKYITTTGWYRIAECQFDSANNASGRLGQFVEVNVRSSLTALHSIKLSLVWNALKWVDELSSSNANPIKQIRYTTNASNKGFIDVYYDNGGSSLYLSADIIAKPFIDACQWTPVDWTSVSASPSGETIRTSHTFNGNAVNFGSGIDAYFGGEVFNSNGDEINQLMRQRARSINETSKYINTAGWYRVFEYTCSNAAQAQGGVSAEFNISLLVSNNGNSSSNHRITLLLSDATAQFVNETSRSGVTTFNKIRYMTIGTKGYIDVYYNSSNNNYVSAEIESIAFYKGTPVDFTLVVAAPQGETLRTEYTFQANVNNDAFYSVGDTDRVYGYVPGAMESANTIGFSAMLPRGVKSGESVSISALRISPMGTNGRIEWDSWETDIVGLSGYTYTATFEPGDTRLLYITVKKSSGNFAYVSGGTPVRYSPVNVWANFIFSIT